MNWELEIHQLDVGQGDAAIVLFKKQNIITGTYEIDKAVLVDAGNVSGIKIVKNQLRTLIGTRKLDAIIISHFDTDHYRGLFGSKKGNGGYGIRGGYKEPNIFESYCNDKTHLICPSINMNSADDQIMFNLEIQKHFSKNRRHIGENGIFENSNSIQNIFNLCAWEIEGGTPNIDFIGVDKTVHGFPNRNNQNEVVKSFSNGNVSAQNATSLMCAINFENFVYITAGDLHSLGENLMIPVLKSLYNSKSIVYKIAHHGSIYSTIDAVDQLKILQPLCGTCSFGHGNGYPKKNVAETFRFLPSTENNPISIDLYTTSPAGNIEGLTSPGSPSKTPNKTYKGHITFSAKTSEAKEGSFRINFLNSIGKTVNHYYTNTYKCQCNDNINKKLYFGATAWLQYTETTMRRILTEEAVRRFKGKLGEIGDKILYYSPENKHPHLTILKNQRYDEQGRIINTNVNPWMLIRGLFDALRINFLKEEVVKNFIQDVFNKNGGIDNIQEILTPKLLKDVLTIDTDYEEKISSEDGFLYKNLLLIDEALFSLLGTKIPEYVFDKWQLDAIQESEYDIRKKEALELFFAKISILDRLSENLNTFPVYYNKQKDIFIPLDQKMKSLSIPSSESTNVINSQTTDIARYKDTNNFNDNIKRLIEDINNIPFQQNNLQKEDIVLEPFSKSTLDTVTDSLNGFLPQTPERQTPISEYNKDAYTPKPIDKRITDLILRDEDDMEINNATKLFQNESLEPPTESYVQKLQKETNGKGLKIDSINL